MTFELPNWAVAVNWYGLCMALGYAFWYWTVKHIEGLYFREASINLERLAALLTASAFVGSRLGYFIYYRADLFIKHPLVVFDPSATGMSFYGGFTGYSIALISYCIIREKSAFTISDRLVVAIPIGLLLGRIGNFLNSDLYGTSTDSVFGIVFAKIDDTPRHPVQLYEAFTQGPLLFVVLMMIRSTRFKFVPGALTFSFIILYSTNRLFMETFREPLDGFLEIRQFLVTPSQVYSTFTLVVSISFLIVCLWRGKSPVRE